MFVSDDLIFIELHKTGSSHIVKLLSSLTSGKQIGKHNPARPRHFNGRYTFLSSVRNPWDWYLSLWSYGCDGKGSFYKTVTGAKPRLTGHGWKKNVRHALYSLANEPFRSAREWRDCYRDIEDAGRFRKWLYMMNHADYRADFGEGYSTSAISNAAGFYTYRYLQLCTRNTDKLENSGEVTLKELKEIDRDHCYIDYFIHTENLEEDFVKVLKKCGYSFSEEMLNDIRASGKTNASSNKQDTGYYYDSDTLQLVRKKEQLIIDKFSYSPPVI